MPPPGGAIESAARSASSRQTQTKDHCLKFTHVKTRRGYRLGHHNTLTTQSQQELVSKLAGEIDSLQQINKTIGGSSRRSWGRRTGDFDLLREVTKFDTSCSFKRYTKKTNDDEKNTNSFCLGCVERVEAPRVEPAPREI